MNAVSERLVPLVLVALDEVRPYIRSHGGEVLYCGLDGTELVIELTGSCEGCPLTEVTLRLHIEKAVQVRVPEITKVKLKNG